MRVKKRVKVSSNRQLAIPVEFYRNLDEPDEFDVYQDRDRLILVPVRLEDRFREFTREMREHLRRSGLTGEELITELERKKELFNSQLSQIIDEVNQTMQNRDESH
jgi:bifunctional DNA-binding transcriptional regulator/antitoxin component of YhaV-PrlF toxin-antitoxin module